MIWKRLRRVIGPSALTLCAAHAQAAPGDATRLEYARSEAAKACPDREALRSAVSQRLGYDPFFPAARQTIVVEISDAPDGLRAHMNLVDEQGLIVGSRDLHERAGQCDELVASLALAISIALDPSAALGGESNADQTPALPSGERADDAPSSAEPEPSRAPVASVAPPRAERQHESSGLVPRRKSPLPISARAALFAASGIAPALAWGVRVGLGAGWNWFQLLAEFGRQFPAQRTVESGSVRASLYEGTVAPCWVESWLAGCALVNVGVFHAQGRDIPTPVTHNSLYAAIGARVEATPQLAGPLRLVLDIDALKSVTPVTLRLHGAPIWQTPYAALVIGAGIALQFR